MAAPPGGIMTSGAWTGVVCVSEAGDCIWITLVIYYNIYNSRFDWQI